MKVPAITLVLGPGPEASDAAALVGIELEVWADGAPSGPMGFSMPHTKCMRESGCFSIMSAPHGLCRGHYIMDVGSGQISLIPSSRQALT